jgi:WD40 repeat protein
LSDEQRCPKRLRDFAWYYAAQLARREGRVLRGHTQSVTTVVYSPDGLTLASASRDGTIRLWNSTDWSHKATLAGHAGPVNALAFLAAGNVLMSAGDDRTVRRWNLETGASEVFARGSAPVECLAASHDGKLVAWSSSGLLFWAQGLLPTITLCDAATGANRKYLIGHKDSVAALVFSRDNQLLVSGGYVKDPSVRLWDTTSGKCVEVLRGHEGRIGALALGPGRQSLLSAGERIRFWDLASRSPKPAFANNPTIAINALAVAPNGLTLAIGQWSRDVTIVDTATGSHVATLAGHQQGGVFSLAFSRDGSYLVSAGTDPEIRVWDLAGQLHPAEELTGSSGPLVAVADAGDAGLLAAGREDRLTSWDSATGRLRNSWTAGHGELRAAACSADHRTVFTAGRDGMVRAWNIESAKLLHAWRAHQGAVQAMAFMARDAGLVTAGQDGAVVVWNAPRGTQRRVLAKPGSAMRCLAASADGLLAAGTADGQIRLWNATTGQPQRTPRGHEQEVTSLVFYAGGTRLASSSADTTAKVWDVSTGQCRAIIRPQQGPILGVCVSRDGQTLATTGYKLVLWDALTGQERSVVADPPGFVSCAAFSPDAKRLITGYGDGAVRLRRLAAPDPAAK